MTATEITHLWQTLPGYMRADDEALLDRPLLSYLTGIASRMQAFADLVARLNHYAADPDAAIPSDLTDPDSADANWLPWLAQAPGVRLDGLADLVARRDAVRYAAAGWRVGTKTAIADAARSALIGSRYVKVYDHSVTAPGDGGPMDLLIVTRVAETPDVSAVLAAVAAKGAKPAGVQLHHMAYSATLAETRAALGSDTLAARQARFPTFQDASDYLP